MKKVEKKPLISYSCIRPDDRGKSIGDVIKMLPSKKSIEWVSSLHFRKSTSSINQLDYELFSPLMSYIDNKLKNNIEGYIQEVEGKDYGFIDNVALLILLDKLLTVHNDNINELSEANYSNLMIAYLMCCDERISLSEDTVDIINENMDADSFVKIYLPERLKYYDTEYRDIRVELIRSFMFKDFCEKNDTFKPLFEIYLNSMNTRNWEEYQFFVLDLYSRMTQKSDGRTNGFEINPVSYYGRKYLDAMSVDINNFKTSPDFERIRDKPVYYQGDNKYHILSINFFIDKLFQSFLFDFAKVLAVHNKVSFKMSYGDLKSKVGDLFSEKCLFYAIMQCCFEQTCDVRISGQELKECLKGGEPDYYLRKGKNIFLFEFKDVMLNAKTKHCDDFAKIKQEILKKFESSISKNNRTQDKGITQLLNVIEYKLDDINKEIDKVEYSDDLNVFPVIIYQDCNFDIEGVNYILNNRFQELLKPRNILKQYIIQNLVMFSLTTLIQLEDFFSKGELDLGQIIEGYINECSLSKWKNTRPFEKYILSYAIYKGYNKENTKRFDDIIDSIEKKIIK